MLIINQLRLPITHTPGDLLGAAAKAILVPQGSLSNLEILNRAIDARRGRVELCYSIRVQAPEPEKIVAKLASPRVQLDPGETYSQPQSTATPLKVIVVGSGPCGLTCALMLARAGWNPILLERGKAAGDRARDVTGFWRRNWAFDPQSNVQFGEGGAGTFSDGKLYTQIRDREQRIPWLLKEWVLAGAPEDILTKARPHIGTDRLIKVVRAMREEIIALGGEVRFSTQVTDLLRDGDRVTGVQLATGDQIDAQAVVLAVGHSARDTFEMLVKQQLPLEAKPFSVGVRIEHPQQLIDRGQFGEHAGHEALGAAPYKFVAHCPNGRAAYSFCMCPGGLVVAATSEPGQVVTNGMSSYARAESNANSGFMVELKPDDIPGEGPMAGIEYQRDLERRAFDLGGGTYSAPAQLLGDFMAGRPSTGPGKVLPSYQPGVTWTDLALCLPELIVTTLRQAIPIIERQLPGFALDDAVLTGIETRSSSPLRLARDPDTLQCTTLQGLYPAGEGAGYAGGIVSAAVDGMKVAERILAGAIPS
jgi:uncharacterized protein